jgi:glycerol dehydrogenase
MPNVFMATGHYIQGPGAIDLIGEKAANLGKRLVIIGDRDVLGLFADRVRKSIERAGIVAEIYSFSGEITLKAIDALSDRARDHSPDAIVGIGGGRAIDAGKGVARRLDKPFVSVPTVASSDAPAARGIGIYDDEHRPVVVEQLKHNPAYVLVDSEVIAKAPPRFLRSGIGDAISKKFEAEGSWAGGGITKHGTRPLHSPVLIANDCYRLLRAHGAAAIRAVEAGKVTDDVECVIEAATLLSCLAFENGGLWLAHSIVRGLLSVRGAKDALHGFQVAYATLVQMNIERRPNGEIIDLMRFLREVGLPICLRELGVDNPTDEEIGVVAQCTSESPYIRMCASLYPPNKVARAIRSIEILAASMSRNRKSGKKRTRRLRRPPAAKAQRKKRMTRTGKP